MAQATAHYRKAFSIAEGNEGNENEPAAEGDAKLLAVKKEAQHQIDKLEFMKASRGRRCVAETAAKGWKREKQHSILATLVRKRGTSASIHPARWRGTSPHPSPSYFASGKQLASL